MHERASPSPVTASLVALIAAYAICTAVIVFSWPDPHDRKQATSPNLAECCEVKIADTAPAPRRAPASRVLGGEPSRATEGQPIIVPASVR
jgi:hypothetical protein